MIKLFDGYNDLDPEYDERPATVECKNCGAAGLEWLHTGVRWRLMEGKKLHVCKASADDFGVPA